MEALLTGLTAENIPFGVDRKSSDDSDANKFVLRVNLTNRDECNEFMRQLSAYTNSQWIVVREINNSERFGLHTFWTCHHSRKNKNRYRPTTKQPRGSQKCIDCEARVDIKVKLITVDTKKKDPFLRIDPPLCAVVTANANHNHSLESADALRHLSAHEDVTSKFLDYFSDGLSPGEAMRAHENAILVGDNSIKNLASGATNPTSRVVYRLHKKWRETHFGSALTPPLEKLKEKVAAYAEKGIRIHIREATPWVVLIVTDVMHRAQMLPSSSEIIFLDSTASVDSTHVTLTQLLTATRAGAIQIATLIHQDQTAKAYTSAFSLLVEHFPHCFGGLRSPAVFMTDDSRAEKSALMVVFPTARQLLCHFHMAQAEWRWLMSSSSGVQKHDRQELMKLFRAVMYSKTDADLAAAIDAVDVLDEQDKFVTRLHENLERQQEWVALFRLNLLTRNHDTNNFAEASIRIMKDIILQRTKAFNVVALAEFCSVVWDQYIVTRLLNFAHNRRSRPVIMYEGLCKRMRNVDPKDAVKVDDSTWDVPSATSTGQMYRVDVIDGVCTCPSGRQGGFCKHQAWLHRNFNTPFASAPAVTESQRYSLAKLALGDKCPPSTFFEGLKGSHLCSGVDNTLSRTTVSIEESHDDDDHDDFQQTASDNVDHNERTEDFVRTRSEAKRSAVEAFTNFVNLMDDITTNAPTKHLLKFVEKCSRIQTCGHAMDSLLDLNAAMTRVNGRGGPIRVQPTALARRRCGVTRGSKRIASGRPVSEPSVKRIKKKQRNLSINIAQNQANAKSHGTNH